MVGRTSTARSGDLTVRVTEAPEVRAGGDLQVQLEVANDAVGPRDFEPDAKLSAAGTAVPFLARSSVAVVGEPTQSAIDVKAINPSVPVAFDLRFDQEGLGGSASRVLRQTMPGARADQPQVVAFVLGRTPSAAARSPIRTTPSRLPGVRLRLPGARAVLPPGWSPDRAETRRLARTTTAGGRPRYARVWRGRGPDGADKSVVLSVYRRPGIGAAMERNSAAVVEELGSALARKVSGLPDGGSRILPATDLGGRTAGLMNVVAGEGPGTLSGRLMIGAQDDLLYVVAAFGPLVGNDSGRGLISQIRRSWSWSAVTRTRQDAS